MEYYADKVALRIIDNSGLHNPTFTTVGAEVDRSIKRSALKGFGLYRASISVEDRELGDCDFRHRQHVRAMVDESVDAMDKKGLLDYTRIKEQARVSRVPKVTWGSVLGAVVKWAASRVYG